jgi:hypothetical protein
MRLKENVAVVTGKRPGRWWADSVGPAELSNGDEPFVLFL